MPVVVCLGDVMTDVVARLPRELAHGSDTPALVAVSGGGSAANTAAWLVEADCAAVLIARVGDDPAGTAARVALEAGGVRARLAVDSRRPTGTCIVLVSPDGERTMIPDAGANAALTATDLPQAEFAPGRHLHVSAYALFQPVSREAALAAFALAEQRQMSCSVDAASAAPLAALGPDRVAGWVPAAATLLCNTSEARVLSGLDDPEDAAVRLAERHRQVVVKCGSDGAICAVAGSPPVRVPTTPVDTVDTTGAGDAFAAGFLSAVRSGAGPLDAVRAGHRLGARAVTVVGGRPR